MCPEARALSACWARWELVGKVAEDRATVHMLGEWLQNTQEIQKLTDTLGRRLLSSRSLPSELYQLLCWCQACSTSALCHKQREQEAMFSKRPDPLRMKSAWLDAYTASRRKGLLAKHSLPCSPQDHLPTTRWPACHLGNFPRKLA